MTPEKQLKARIRNHIRSLGGVVFTNVSHGYGGSGVDLHCCLQGHFYAIEVKAPGNKPTARQNVVLDAVSAAGGTAFWCDDFADFLEQL